MIKNSQDDTTEHLRVAQSTTLDTILTIGVPFMNEKWSQFPDDQWHMIEAFQHTKGFQEAKVQLTAYLEAQTRAARLDEREIAIAQLDGVYQECVRHQVLTEDGLNGYHCAIEDACKDRDDRIAVLTATTLQEMPQGSEGDSEVIQ
jgi:hypothetical protein